MKVSMEGTESIGAQRVDIEHGGKIDIEGKGYHFVIEQIRGGIAVRVNGLLVIHPRGADKVILTERKERG